MKKLMMLALVLVSCSAFATGEDLVNCRYREGQAMNPLDCASFRRLAAEDKAKDEAYEKIVMEMREQQKRTEDVRQAEKAKQQAIIDEEGRKRIAEIARRDEEIRRIREQEDREEAEQEAALKHKCGKDYMTPRIGMTLPRAKQCIGEFELVSQINRKDGVISTYAYGRTYINVMKEKIVSWHSL